MTKEELKLCPFCGESDLSAGKNFVTGAYDIECPSCGLRISNKDKDCGVVYWNTRPIEDALRIRAEAAEETLKIIFNSLGGEK